MLLELAVDVGMSAVAITLYFQLDQQYDKLDVDVVHVEDLSDHPAVWHAQLQLSWRDCAVHQGGSCWAERTRVASEKARGVGHD